jgi:hypothetical protein
MKTIVGLSVGLTLAATLLATACSSDDESPPAGPDAATPKDPAAAEVMPVDRFSATAGHLMVRDGQNGLPAANAAINFDQEPFVTQGFGPDGQVARYYNFDVQSDVPAKIFVLFAPGAQAPVPGQLNIVDVVPGETGYSDFWQVVKVTVPASYVANTITSAAEITAAKLATEATTMVVNCPLVPPGSTATKRLGGGSAALMKGWYKGKLVHYFSFEEAALSTNGGKVPTSPIWVTFNKNPGEPGGGPPSGFVTEPGSAKTHNVLGSVAGDIDYSPLWAVQIYDNADFSKVNDQTTAKAAKQLVADAALVNCPLAELP